MKAKEFEERFDAGEDMAAALDTARARRPGDVDRHGDGTTLTRV